MHKTLMGGTGQLVADDFWEPSGGPTYYGILKRWTGAAWVKAKLLVRVGGSFLLYPLKRWTGAAWVEVDGTGV
jgi:hypothetical protein